MRNTRWLMIVVLLVGLLATGGVVAAEDTVKIGVVLPMSPPGAYSSGHPMWWAVQQAVDEVNEAGGVLGRPVEAILGDTRGIPEEGRAVTERLIVQNEVVGVVGNYHSSVALAQLDLFERYNIPYIGAEPWADDVTARGLPQVFRISITNTLYTDITAAWMQTAGLERIAIVQETTDWGLGAHAALVQRLDEYGIHHETVFADVATEDFTSILLQFRRWDPAPDLLYAGITGPGGYRIVRQAYELGLAPTPDTLLYPTNVALDPEFWENVGEAGKYNIVTQIGVPPAEYTAVTERANAVFRENHGRMMTSTVMEGYDSFMLMVEAIKAAGSTDPDAIIDALEHIEWEGMRGTYYFSYGSHNPVPDDEPAYMWHQWPDVGLYLFQYTEVGQDPEDGTVIWPARWAEVDPPYYIPVP